MSCGTGRFAAPATWSWVLMVRRISRDWAAIESARFGKMLSCLRSVRVSQRTSLRLLAVSGLMTCWAAARVATPFLGLRFAAAPLDFVRATVLVFDFMSISSSFDFKIKI